MYNANIPKDTEVPSTAKLIKSTILAAVTAGVLLVTVVMPAEYGIDPTGVGNAIGLKRMGEIKTSLAAEAEADAALALEAAPVSEPVPDSQTLPPGAIKSDETSITLAPDASTEIKLVMVKGAKVQYSWETNGGKANFDVHGDSKELKVNYHGYYKGSEQKSEGTLEAAFNGNHGWFWRNRTAEPMTITLKTNGEYTELKRF